MSFWSRCAVVWGRLCWTGLTIMPRCAMTTFPGPRWKNCPSSRPLGTVYYRLYWVTQKLPQISTVILRIRIGKVAWFAVYICGNFWVTQYNIYLCFGLYIVAVLAFEFGLSKPHLTLRVCSQNSFQLSRIFHYYCEDFQSGFFL